MDQSLCCDLSQLPPWVYLLGAFLTSALHLLGFSMDSPARPSKFPGVEWACLPLALAWCASSILPGTLASGRQLQLLISALILNSMRFQPPAYAKTALSPLPLCPILSVCPIPSYVSNNISQTLCHLVKVKLSLSQTGECAVTPVHCLLQCTLIKLFLHGYQRFKVDWALPNSSLYLSRAYQSAQLLGGAKTGIDFARCAVRGLFKKQLERQSWGSS